MLTTDQAQTQQWVEPLNEQRGSLGLMDIFSRESALEGQFGGAFANGHENRSWSFSTLGQNRSSAIPFVAPGAITDVSLGTHIKKARSGIAKLLELERHAEQFKTHQEGLAWLAKNRGRYSGQWVALRGDVLLAVGKDAREVYARVRGQKPVPLVVKIESEQLPFAGW